MPIAPGVVIGDRYRLVELIGEGGMGSVWRAEHVSLERPVAVKFVRSRPEDRDLAARFLREAKATAAVHHRNVIDVIDFGSTVEGAPYIVMELLRGRNLWERMGQLPALTTAELVRIAAGVLTGLASVHDKGILHRDLKPENVFLAQEDEEIVPKVVDFGLSRGFGSIDPVTRVTVPGSVLGTPFYMSPEQIRDEPDIDLRTDLYSMGVLLFEALSGQLPFQKDEIGDLLVSIVTDEPPVLLSLRPEIGELMSDVVHRAMQKSPADRFSNAREMREALQEAVQFTGAATVVKPARKSWTAPTPPTPARLPSAELAAEPTVLTRPVDPQIGTSTLTVPVLRRGQGGPWAMGALVLVVLTVVVVAIVGLRPRSRRPPPVPLAVPTLPSVPPLPAPPPAEPAHLPSPPVPTPPTPTPTVVGAQAPPRSPPPSSPTRPRRRPVPSGRRPGKAGIIDRLDF